MVQILVAILNLVTNYIGCYEQNLEIHKHFAK